MRFKLRGLTVSGLLFLSACSTFSAKKASSSRGHTGDHQDVVEPHAQIKEAEVSSEDVEENEQRPYKSSYGDIDLVDNAQVRRWIAYFQGRGRHFMETYLARSTRYLPMMKNVLRENGLPEDLVYVSLIESGFSPMAQSRSNAVGYWQFIRSTARRFGLTVNQFIDERRDPVLSTRAAADYFKSLYQLFGSWELALSAYNVGELRVQRAVSHYYTRDFWKLARKRRALPRETKNYVPKFIAAVTIAHDPSKYGFKHIAYEDPLSYDTVLVQRPVSLTKLASNLQVDVDELQLLNPKFRTDYVPLMKDTQTILRIPVGRGSDALAAMSLSVMSQPKVMTTEYRYYRIRRGDNLSTIAHRHHTTVSMLRRLNHLSNRTLLRIGRRLKIPDREPGVKLARYYENVRTGRREKSPVVPAVAYRSVASTTYHVVRRGENLSTIAHRYHVRIKDLVRLNNLHSRSFLRSGQRLKIRETTPRGRSAQSARSAHVVRRGESLWTLSQKYGVPISKLAHVNNMKVHSHLLIGQKIVIPHQNSRRIAGATRRHLVHHTVKRGETLWDLSKKYGIPMSRLARINGFSRSHHIMVGEEVVIPNSQD